jgi:hypothetical protein
MSGPRTGTLNQGLHNTRQYYYPLRHHILETSQFNDKMMSPTSNKTLTVIENRDQKPLMDIYRFILYWCCKRKLKVFPALVYGHYLEGVWGRGCCCNERRSKPREKMGGKWPASRLGRFVVGETTPWTHWIGGREGLRAGLGASVTRRISYTTAGNRTPIYRWFCPYRSHCSD